MHRSIGRLGSKYLKAALRGVGTRCTRAYLASIRRRERRRALEVAMEQFSMLHPTWHETFFDEGFLDRLPTGALDHLDATSLSREWARQFRYGDERRRDLDVKRLTPIAADFLMLLATAEARIRASRPTRPRARTILPPTTAAVPDPPASGEGASPCPGTVTRGCP